MGQRITYFSSNLDPGCSPPCNTDYQNPERQAHLLLHVSLRFLSTDVISQAWIPQHVGTCKPPLWGDVDATLKSMIGSNACSSSVLRKMR